jgi:hypothetical protein
MPKMSPIHAQSPRAAAGLQLPGCIGRKSLAVLIRTFAVGEIHQHVDGANQLPGFIEDGCWIGGKGYARSVPPDAPNGMTFLLFTIAREKSRGFAVLHPSEREAPPEVPR